MPDINKLYQTRADLVAKARQYVEDHTGENGVMAAEDVTVYERMEEDISNISASIKRQEKIDAREQVMNQPVRSAIVDRPGEFGSEKSGVNSEAYNQAFNRYLKCKEVPLSVRNDLEVGTAAEGGYLVPDEFERKLIESLDENNIFRRLATVIRTDNGTLKIPVVSSKGTAAWLDEEAAFTATDDVFSQVTLGAYKVGRLVKISDELLADSAFNMSNYLANSIGRSIGMKEEEAFLNGTGATGTQPTGLLAATGGADTGVTAASETAITADELIDMQHSVKAPYRGKAVWIMNDATVKLIRKLKLTGTGEYLWQPSLVAGVPDRILGNPVYTSQYMPTAAAGKKVMLFGDMSYYWVADRGQRVLKRLNELYAANGQVGFLGWHRVDGKLVLGEAVKVLAMKATTGGP